MKEAGHRSSENHPESRTDLLLYTHIFQDTVTFLDPEERFSPLGLQRPQLLQQHDLKGLWYSHYVLDFHKWPRCFSLFLPPEIPDDSLKILSFIYGFIKLKMIPNAE
jgi:hypothetical protein